MAANHQTVLVADPESDFLAWAEKHLGTPTTRVLGTTDAGKAYEIYEKEKPDLLIAEFHLQPFSGMDLLKKVRLADPNAMVILNTGFPATSGIIEAMRLGAFDFLRKETLPYDLRPVVEEVLKAREDMESTHAAAVPHPVAEPDNETIIGNSMAMQEVIKMIGRVSRSDAPVLITGESGSGKEVVANAIHRFSRRSTADYVAINCAAIPENLLESELFGHEKGSFTGATGRRVGRFEQCNDGTLFLDEIGDTPLSVQSKSLRVMPSGEFSRHGGNDSLTSSARIIAATNKVLEKAVSEGSFREDLYYRLNVVRIHIPPLRQRREDIRPLAQFFLRRIAEKGGPRLQLSEEAVEMIENYNWPGNVRELENTIYRSTVLATTDVLLPSNIPLGNLSEATTRVRPRPPAKAASGTEAEQPGEVPDANGTITVEQAVETLLNAAEKDPSLELLPWMEREMTTHAMKRTGGNQLKAAKLLGITRATLRKRLERFGIEKEKD